MEATDQLSANIALLANLGRVLGPPKSNRLNESGSASAFNAEQGVSLKHETIFVEYLSFICAYSDDPLHVVAVCVERKPEPGGVIIRLAANTGKHQALVDGLKEATAILQEESKQGRRRTSQDDLLRAVVRLNRMRILSRIRSQHASSNRARKKPCLLRRCKKFQTLLPETAPGETATPSLTERLVGVIAQLEQLESMETANFKAGHADTLLLSLVRDTRRMVVDCERDFALVPCTPGSWNEGETTSLLGRLQKLARYPVACQELLRVVRHYECFSDIEVTFLDLQQKGPRLSPRGKATVDQLLHNAIFKKGRSISASHRKSFKARNDAIRSQLLSSSRLHAEIQIALFYEQNPPDIHPRVICASKNACYLCDLFLRLHGRYRVPGTHGRIYDAWGWPFQRAPPSGGNNAMQHRRPAFEAILRTFSQTVETKLGQILQQSHLTKYGDPAESLVDFSLAMTASVSTQRSGHHDLTNGAGSAGSNAAKSAAVSSRQRSPAALHPHSVGIGSGTVSHRFNDDTRALRWRLPRLDVEVLHVLSGEDPASKFLDIEIEVLHASDRPVEEQQQQQQQQRCVGQTAYIVNVDQCDTTREMTLPYGVAMHGILLQSGSSILRLQAVGSNAVSSVVH